MSSSKAMPFKPSPLGYGSNTPRSSPFRRPESTPGPTSPSALRQTTPTSSPSNKMSPFEGGGGRPLPIPRTPTMEFPFPTPKATYTSTANEAPQRLSPRSPIATRQPVGHGSSITQLQSSQVRALREGFQILDRDSDGVVNREDVVEMLNQLGRAAAYTSLRLLAC